MAIIARIRPGSIREPRDLLLLLEALIADVGRDALACEASSHDALHYTTTTDDPLVELAVAVMPRARWDVVRRITADLPAGALALLEAVERLGMSHGEAIHRLVKSLEQTGDDDRVGLDQAVAELDASLA